MITDLTERTSHLNFVEIGPVVEENEHADRQKVEHDGYHRQCFVSVCGNTEKRAEKYRYFYCV